MTLFIYKLLHINNKLTDMAFPESTRESIVHNIFCTQQGTIYVKGLIDAADIHEFDYKLSKLEEK